VLTERIMAELGLERVEEIIPRVYRQGMSHEQIAALAPLVFQAAREGDLVAGEILDCAGRELGLMAAAVVARLGMEPGAVRIALVGSLFRDKELLLEPLRAALGGEVSVEFVEPRLAPVGGAAILALKATGADIGSKIVQKLEESPLGFSYLTKKNETKSS